MGARCRETGGTEGAKKTKTKDDLRQQEESSRDTSGKAESGGCGDDGVSGQWVMETDWR